MFSSWVFAQRDRSDAVGSLGKLLFEDYNAGCAGGRWSPLDWVAHFEDRHPKASNRLKDAMGDAYLEYLAEMKETA